MARVKGSLLEKKGEEKSSSFSCWRHAILLFFTTMISGDFFSQNTPFFPLHLPLYNILLSCTSDSVLLDCYLLLLLCLSTLAGYLWLLLL